METETKMELRAKLGIMITGGFGGERGTQKVFFRSGSPAGS